MLRPLRSPKRRGITSHMERGANMVGFISVVKRCTIKAAWENISNPVCSVSHFLEFSDTLTTQLSVFAWAKAMEVINSFSKDKKVKKHFEKS